MRRISELTIEQSMQAAAMAYSNRQYRQHFFPTCDTVEQFAETLATLNQEWKVIGGEKISALFTFETSQTTTTIDYALTPVQ